MGLDSHFGGLSSHAWQHYLNGNSMQTMNSPWSKTSFLYLAGKNTLTNTFALKWIMQPALERTCSLIPIFSFWISPPSWGMVVWTPYTVKLPLTSTENSSSQNTAEQSSQLLLLEPAVPKPRLQSHMQLQGRQWEQGQFFSLLCGASTDCGSKSFATTLIMGIFFHCFKVVFPSSSPSTSDGVLLLLDPAEP